MRSKEGHSFDLLNTDVRLKRISIMTATLAAVPDGGFARVKAVVGDEPISKRLMEMGIVPGVSIKVVKSAPFGDPIEIRVLGYNLAIRRNEAATIHIDLIDQ